MGTDISVQPGTPTQAELAAAQQAAQQASAVNLAWRAVNAPETLSSSEQQYASSYRDAMDAAREQQKHDIAFSQPRNDIPQAGQGSSRYEEILAQYAAQQNRVVSSGGYVYQGKVSSGRNPYPEDTAAGIAWKVAQTGGASDYFLNLKAEAEIRRVGGDAGFIRYATDIYAERPSFAREDITTPAGQHFVNQEWSGVPIRLNLTREEIAAGGPINAENYQKFYKYQPETRMLERLGEGGYSIGVDIGVHKAPGDWGGPLIDKTTGAYGGWQPRISGTKVVAAVERGIPVQEGVDVRVPVGAGERILHNAKVAVDQRTGEIAIYQKDMLGRWGLVGGAGRNAAQSEEFYVSPPSAMGKVNLATFSAPVAFGKAEAPGADIPWNISPKTAAVSFMDQSGITKAVPGYEGNGMIRGTTVVAATDSLIESKELPNIYTVYDQKLAVYNTKLAEYEAGGSKDFAAYSGLESMRKELVILGHAKYGAELQNVFLTPVEKEEVPKTIATSVYDIFAPAGSFQRNVIENVSIIPAGPSIGGQISIGSNIARDVMGGNYGNLWESVNIPMARQYSQFLPDIRQIPEETIASGIRTAAIAINPYAYPMVQTEQYKYGSEFVASASKEIYTRSREYPVENVMLAAVPLAFKAGEYGIAAGIAKATETPGFKTLGRALSTPIATDVGQYLVKGALVAPWVVESTRNIIEAPDTAIGKGKAVGEVGYQVTWMGAGTGVAEGFARLAPENAFYGKGFFSGKPEPRPLQTLKGDITIEIAALELRARGLGEEGKVLKDFYNIAKAYRFSEPAVEQREPLKYITDVPLEHRAILEKALGENFAVIYGSGGTYGQTAPGTRVVDYRAQQIEALSSEEFTGSKTLSEQIDVFTKLVEPQEYESGKYPVSMGADVDIMANAEGVSASIMKEPGAILQVRVEGTRGKPAAYYITESGGETIKLYEPGYEAPTPKSSRFVSVATAEREGVKFEEIEAIYAKGAKFALDIHEPVHGYPSIAREVGYRPKTGESYPEDWRTPITFKILGSPFESIPRQSDILFASDKTGKVIPQEKIGFQLQRLGDAISKDLMSGIERYPNDPLYRGYRYEKDIYRAVSTAQSVLATERQRIAVERAGIKGEGKAQQRKTRALDIREQTLAASEKRIGNILERDIRYQLGRGEEPVVVKTRDLMEIGLERLQTGMSVSGSEIGPIRTTVGESKFLKEYEVPEPRDVAKDIAWEKRFVPRQEQKLQPGSIKPKRVTEGKLLSEMEYKPKSMEERLAKYKKAPIEERTEDIVRDTRDIVEDFEAFDNTIIPIRTTTPAKVSTSAAGTYEFTRWLNPKTPLKMSEADVLFKISEMERRGWNEISMAGHSTEKTPYDIMQLRDILTRAGYKTTPPSYEPGVGVSGGTWVMSFEKIPATSSKIPTVMKTPSKMKYDIAKDTRDIIDNFITREPAFTKEYRIGSAPSRAPKGLSIFEGFGFTSVRSRPSGAEKDIIGSMMSRRTPSDILKPAYKMSSTPEIGSILSMRSITDVMKYEYKSEPSYASAPILSSFSLPALPPMVSIIAPSGGGILPPSAPKLPSYKPPSTPELPYVEPPYSPRMPEYSPPPPLPDITWPGGGVGMGGGAGGWPMGSYRTSKRQYQNPVVDIQYLSALPGFFGRKGSRK